MRILFLNRAYLPDLEATGQFLAELAEDLSAHHQVSVLCGRPNFGELRGRIFPYRRDRLREVDIWRAWGTGWPKRIPAARAVNQASFFALASVAARRLPGHDVVVSLTDPPFVGLLGLSLKRRFGAPFVYWCMDLYPDVAQAVGMAPGLLASAFERVQARVLGGADAVIALGDDMAARLAAKGVAAERIAVIHNWADTEAIKPLNRDNGFRTRHGLGDRFVVMYSGNFGYVWDLDSVLDAAAHLRERKDLVFVLIGGGSTRGAVERRIGREGLSNVLLYPYQDRGQLAESLSAADLHLVPMRPGVYGAMVPSKIYGILASGTPTAVLAEKESEAARIVRQHRCGWRGDPGDAGALVQFIQTMCRRPLELETMGRRAREAAERHYSRATQTRKFRELLESVAQARSKRAVG
jgi:colanic acid biosynthesis glycosyl transferase WcaI